MKYLAHLLIVLIAVVGSLTVIGGCKPQVSSSANASAPPPATAVRTIEIHAGDSMKFDITRIETHPGEILRIVLINVGNQPKTAMGHNWVLLSRHANVTAFLDAALNAAASAYLPPERASDVLAATALVGPRERTEVVFTAPTEPGDYLFVCTFPAHYQLGMKGLLRVR